MPVESSSTHTCESRSYPIDLAAEAEAGSRREQRERCDERAQARKDKNWALSDELRDKIKALGFAVEDTAKGQKVRKQA